MQLAHLVNEPLLRFFDLRAEELLGSSLGELWDSKPSAKGLQDQIRYTLASGTAFRNVEVRTSRNGGPERRHLVSGSAVPRFTGESRMVPWSR